MQKPPPLVLTSIALFLLLSFFAFTLASHRQARRPEVKSQRVSRATGATPTKKPSSIPSPTASPRQPQRQTGTLSLIDEQKYIMGEINAYRRQNGLSNVSTDKYTCGFAKVRAQEIATRFNHDGFRSRIDNKTLPYPDYKLVTENLASTDDYRKVVRLWVNSNGHAENMRKDTPYVCVAKNGKYYAYEGLRL